MTRWAVFHDEDGAWRIVTTDGDDVTWPEMGEADVERAVNDHNAAHDAIRAASQPPSGDAPDLREALDGSARELHRWHTEHRNDRIAFEGCASPYCVDARVALAASAPSSPATPAPGREALWEKFTGGEKLAYGCGYRDALATPAPLDVEIRGTNPYQFRSGHWARLVGVEWANGRACYRVRFPDGATDSWVIEDPSEHYEFRAYANQEGGEPRKENA